MSPPGAPVDFALTDQHGNAFSMSGTRGKVSIVTFLYTHCTDTCPFLALKVKEAGIMLGADAARVAFVAVTTDPKRDTVPVMADYSRAIGLFDVWHFLTGAPDAVSAVWKGYGIGVRTQAPGDEGTTTSGGPEVEHGQGLSGADLKIASDVIMRFGGGYEVQHSAPFWLIDPRGRVRILLDADATPEDIVTDARALLGGA
jgi:cytochrome oxidase Cu insertion factor (SCO1/SenC/PrrC family)